MKNKLLLPQNRREFISNIIPICSFSCLGISSIFSVINKNVGDKNCTKLCCQMQKTETDIHKFQKEWILTYEKAFEWKFGYFIEIMKEMKRLIGTDEFIELIKLSGDKATMKEAENDPKFSFSEWMKGGSVYSNMMTSEVIEHTENVKEIHVTECLWAKIFHEHNAADLGYAYVCYNDFAYAKSVNPKVKLERTKTIMEGHGYCNHRWSFNG